MRFLLIEDDEDIADAIISRLTQSGDDVTWVDNGIDGADYVTDKTLDLIILDLNLPGRDGFDILQEMRSEGIKTPVLAATARSEIDDKISLFDLGADDYLVKPFDMRELEVRIQALIRRRIGEAVSQITFGNLTIDLSTRTAQIEDELLELGRKEFEVLRLLAAAGGKPVSKELMVTKLFGFDDFGSPNAVELLVSRLRRKLSKSSIDILTQRGVGYFLK